jgi:mono/diheme cytochrome c family protein
VREMLPIAIAAVVGLASFGTQAADKLTLKSVSVELPAGDRTFSDGAGADALNNNCLACHSAGMVLYQPAVPRAEWEAVVEKMRTAYKAPIDANDIDAILRYLVSIKGAGG